MAGKGSQPGERRGGRTKGVPNKATMLAREAIAKLVDESAPRMQAWLDEIALKHGALAAWDCMTDVLEYHIPKLARTELTGKDGDALTINVQKSFPDDAQ